MKDSLRLTALMVALSTTVCLHQGWSQTTTQPGPAEGHNAAAAVSSSLPENPQAGGMSGGDVSPAQAAAPSASPQTGTPSGSQAQPANQEDERKRAEDQLKQQEQQRVFGVMSAFNTTQNADALPLTSRQKFQLFFKSATDPWPFTLTAFAALIDQAEGSPEEYGGGIGGYAKRYGAGYTDYFTGNFFGNAVFTSWWHEDPRFFQKTTGSVTSRLLWAAASTVWCKRDNGSWGPNYANVAGNLVGAAISNLYYPASERSVGDTLERGFTVSAEGVVGAEVIEFWPDIVRHYRRKKAEKQARQQAALDADAATP